MERCALGTLSLCCRGDLKKQQSRGSLLWRIDTLSILRIVYITLPLRSSPRTGRADTGAVTLIQRFGSAANLNIHVHCLLLDGVSRD